MCLVESAIQRKGNYEMKYSFETRAFCHLSKRFLSIFKGSRTYNLWWSEWNHLSNTPGSSKNSIFMNLMYFFLGIKTKRFDKWPRQLKRFTNLGYWDVHSPQASIMLLLPLLCFFSPSLLKVMFAMKKSAIYRSIDIQQAVFQLVNSSAIASII